MTAYALFPHDRRYHRVSLRTDRTLCGLATKGRVRGVAERQPPALVTAQRPMLSSHAACSECHAASATEKSRRDQSPLAGQAIQEHRPGGGAE